MMADFDDVVDNFETAAEYDLYHELEAVRVENEQLRAEVARLTALIRR